MAAASDHPTGDTVGESRLLALFELLGVVGGVDRRDLVAARETFPWIGLDPFGTEPLQLLPADAFR